MTKTEQWAESTYRRTKSWQSQPEYDNILSDLTISGLQYLVDKYETNMSNYSQTHNLRDDNNFKEYKEIQQRYKMINEELEKRVLDTWASPTYYKESRYQFDSTTGTVYEDDGVPLYTVDFNEEESGFIVRNLEGAVVESTNSDEQKVRDLSIEERYQGWEYWVDD